MSNIQTIIEGTKVAIQVAAVGGILAILKIAIDGLLDVGVEFLKAKKDTIVQQIGVDKYNSIRQLAIDVYNRVEEDFKGQIGVSQQKLEAFDKYIAEKIPGISQDDITHFRQAICGDANAKLIESGIIKPEDAQKSAALQQAQAQAVQLTQENATLKQTLAGIQSAATVQK